MLDFMSWKHIALLSLLSLSSCTPFSTPRSSSEALRPRKVELDSNGYEIGGSTIDVNSPDHHLNFQQFVSRPDIDAPRWDIKVHDPEAMAPGYWFTAPYLFRLQNKRGGGWVGPHIYDSTGELAWSGVPQFGGFDTFDFRMASVQGEDKLTLIYRHKSVVILNDDYTTHKKLDMQDYDKTAQLNMHDFHVVDNGTRAIMMKTITRMASKEESVAAGYKGGRCRVKFYGFEDLDTATWKYVFSWSSEGHIPVKDTESIFSRKAVCESRDGFDYLHANAVDKFPNGDYLLSARNTNSIYRISGKDGSIVWRFHGTGGGGDFAFDEHFQGQHDARILESNGTHTIISFLDNAYGPSNREQYTADFSRGFIVSLNTELMTALVLSQFDHPHADYAPGRGNVQLLSNGNTLVGWTTQSLFSEHAPNGSLVMEASLKPVLKSYRSYKFPWIGRPAQPPDVHSTAVADPRDGGVTTAVYVSWNGATEVASWNIYNTDADGSAQRLIASVVRQGFETEIVHRGFARYVVAEALDEDGKVLGKSLATTTVTLSDKDGERWSQNQHPPQAFSQDDVEEYSFYKRHFLVILAGLSLCGLSGLLGYCGGSAESRRKSASCYRGQAQYESLSVEEKYEDSMEFDVEDLEGETEVDIDVEDLEKLDYIPM